jgi:predicted aspartyl protease
MGLTYADIEVENLFGKRALPLKALVDSGAVFLSIPAHIAVQLGFDTDEAATREIILAK